MRVSRIKYLQNSRYVMAHFRHFITNQSNTQTVKACALACHLHDYCRTANYYSINSICSLYEESSHVGKIISSLSTTVIKIQLCPDEIDELTHICHGDPARARIPLQTAFNSMSLVQMLPISAAAIIMTIEFIYVPISGTASVRVYDMRTMVLVNTFSESCNIYFFDMTIDSNGNVQNTATSCQSVTGLLLNGNMLPSSNNDYFSAPCFNDKDLVALMVNVNKLRIWSYNTTYLYDINGFSFNFISSRACVVLDDTIYLSSNSEVQSVNISGSIPRTLYTMSQNLDAVTTDAVGPHLFVPCGSCSFTGVIVLSLNGAMLAQFNRSVGHAVLKPSNYAYRLVIANDNYLSIYEI